MSATNRAQKKSDNMRTEKVAVRSHSFSYQGSTDATEDFVARLGLRELELKPRGTGENGNDQFPHEHLVGLHRHRVERRRLASAKLIHPVLAEFLFLPRKSNVWVLVHFISAYILHACVRKTKRVFA